MLCSEELPLCLLALGCCCCCCCSCAAAALAVERAEGGLLNGVATQETSGFILGAGFRLLRLKAGLAAKLLLLCLFCNIVWPSMQCSAFLGVVCFKGSREPSCSPLEPVPNSSSEEAGQPEHFS